MSLRAGDCIEVMRELDECSVDAVVTDPPYGIRFMGKAWDGAEIEESAQRNQRDVSQHTRLTGSPDSPNRKLIARTGSAFQTKAGEAGSYDFSLTGNRAFQAWCEAWAREALRVLKPGGHALVFGGTRTYHRLASGMEDAGFEIRDCIAWLFGSGFPKSLDVSKAIDKAAGHERVGYIDTRNGPNTNPTSKGDKFSGGYENEQRAPDPPTTEDARRWQGWGTALKPAHEPIVVARKPLAGTVAANVLEHGTGALNVDGCRVATDDRWSASGVQSPSSVALEGGADGSLNVSVSETHDLGRWPANVVLDEQAAAMLDEQTGELRNGGQNATSLEPNRGMFVDGRPATMFADDSGGASRFFYCAKASRAERNAGLEKFPATKQADDGYGSIQRPTLDRAVPRENWQPHRTANHHPTVKPIDLMRWLVRLVAPPGLWKLDRASLQVELILRAIEERENVKR